MKKNTEYTQRKQTGKTFIIIGFAVVLFSLFVPMLANAIGASTCSKNSFGECTLDSNLMTGIISSYLPYLVAVVGLIILIYGIIALNKK